MQREPVNECHVHADRSKDHRHSERKFIGGGVPDEEGAGTVPAGIAGISN